jgi:ribose 1,5-bisphosphokinase PhnN
VIHVSQLKLVVPASEELAPTAIVHMQVPEAILQKKLLARGTSTVEQVLIKRSSMSQQLATWEDMEAIKQAFPLTF